MHRMPNTTSDTRGTFSRGRLALALFCWAALAAVGCTHDLAVRNLGAYSAPMSLGGGSGAPPTVGVRPFAGGPDDVFFFNTLVEKLNLSRSLGDVRTDYVPEAGRSSDFDPDIVLSIRPRVAYRSSGWNFLINWPGFLIFTPSWNGYVYHADVFTEVEIADGSGQPIDTVLVPISYSIRHAELDRTIFTGLAWFEVSALAFGGGIYNANVFDRDVIGGLQLQVKENYANYVMNQVYPKLRNASRSISAAPPRRESAPSAASTAEDGQPAGATEEMQPAESVQDGQPAPSTEEMQPEQPGASAQEMPTRGSPGGAQ